MTGGVEPELAADGLQHRGQFPRVQDRNLIPRLPELLAGGQVSSRVVSLRVYYAVSSVGAMVGKYIDISSHLGKCGLANFNSPNAL